VPNVDLNVLSDDELARVQGGGDMADCQAYKDALARVVNRIQIEDERKTANGQPATLRRTIVREIASEAFQALQS
jgi:bacteriocin-like protein